jgi:hypothetical protein
MTQEEFQKAVDEVRTEIIMRRTMLEKAFEEKKINYWTSRIDKMQHVFNTLLELGRDSGFHPKGGNHV